MHKRIILVLALGFVLGSSGCQNTPTEDIYNKEATVIESTDETSVVSDETSDQTEETSEVDSESAAQDSEDQTVTEDVYEAGSEVDVVDIDELNVTDVKGVPVDDPELQEKMLAFLEPFYYNIYFGLNDYSETGITEADMVKFSISYVYQNENQAYKFDTDSFKLYVPEERVEELVEKYFGQQMTGHHSFEIEEIEYNGGYYLMPATDIGWNDTMKINSITEAGDFAYEVVFSVNDIEDELIQSYKVMLEIRQDKFILTSYAFTVVEDLEVEGEDQGSDAESEAETTEEASADE